MKRIIWLVPILFTICSAPALADSVTYKITSGSIYIAPNTGSGENAFFTISGPGVSLSSSAGTDTSWFNDNFGSAPGSLGGGPTDFFVDTVQSVKIGNYGTNDIEVDCCNSTLFAGSFKFPSNGKNFVVTIPATISGITGTILPTGQTFTFGDVSGKLTMYYIWYPQTDAYYPNYATFTTTPEPDTLVLMGTGLACLAGSIRRRLLTAKACLRRAAVLG